MSTVQRLKRLYHRLPLSPATKHRLGLFKRFLLGPPGSAPQSVRLDMDSAKAAFGSNVSEDSGREVASTRASELVKRPLEETVVVFYGVIDWHFRHQRPQQLAMALAKRGLKVFYLSVNFVNDRQPGFRWESISDSLDIYQIFLHVSGHHSIYIDVPTDDIRMQQKIGQRMLWEHFQIRDAIHIVQHPYWTDLAFSVPAARLVYDCMDFHAGFSNTSPAHHQSEMALFKRSDLTVVSSDFLYQMAKQSGANALALVRNATEFDHFHKAYRQSKPDAKAVIGYYGAIAEWFDIELISDVARAFPHVEIRLIGADTVHAQSQLATHKNVRFLGEWPYRTLPEQLAEFSVCLIPFRVVDLTLATNPVKVYEYLSAGKPVVAVDLPELRSMDSWIQRCSDSGSFIAAVARALDERDPRLQQARIDYAAAQTWEHRAQQMLDAVDRLSEQPLTSVVVVSFNNRSLTERCLQSLADPRRHGKYAAPLEVIVVDNASADGSDEMLKLWQLQPSDPDSPVRRREVLINGENRGFGPAVNQGLSVATGSYLVILNNDTVVTTGWANGLRRHLENQPTLGLVGPVTNHIGNESMIRLPSGTMEETEYWARRYTLDHGGETYSLSVAAFFCVMMSRSIYERVGGLDEQFVPGFFEDDDYCYRIKQAGYEIACAEDVFVFHELSASFDQLAASKRQAIFERNKALFEAKWGRWIPHQYRPEPTEHGLWKRSTH